MHMLIWNYNGCTSYLMLLLFGETLVIHRFRERLRERETQSHSFSPYLCTGILNEQIVSIKVLVYAKRSNIGFDFVCAIKIAHKHVCQLCKK